MDTALPPWPYPFWIAHRGAGRLAPENTLAALRTGAALGWRMFECDVKLSADHVPFLLHDDTLGRTTDGHGRAAERSWDELAQLDAGRWHGPAFAGEPLPTLGAVARFVTGRGLALNIEIKPCPGRDTLTGALVAQAVRALWQGTALPPPLLSSFSPEALRAARDAAPELPRALLSPLWRADTLPEARSVGAVALVLQHRAWNGATLAAARAAGLRALAYTVNGPREVQRLTALGLDGLITDEVERFADRPDAAAGPAS
ncbi:glycerophosphodiester phosphodiesterase [Caldimonas tepidiphila]|uniref:glycerophosphodiester phosphodiesterase n=1 Tax=Caldimonas tepidiphila TaxID=2315841 RepID=UPI000E5A1826|nr:glycerophosphodiester phosphodiesterase [Caldimonas tepidiphila]